ENKQAGQGEWEDRAGTVDGEMECASPISRLGALADNQIEGAEKNKQESRLLEYKCQTKQESAQKIEHRPLDLNRPQQDQNSSQSGQYDEVCGMAGKAQHCFAAGEQGKT